MKKLMYTILLVTFSQSLFSQIEVVATGLRRPAGIERDSEGNLWIAESGTGANDGAISVIWTDGTQERVMDGFPSLYDSMTQEVFGPWRIQAFNDEYFGVLMSGGLPEVGSSILVFRRDSIFSGGPVLHPENAENIIELEDRVLHLGYVESNVFSFVHNGTDLFMVDAAANAIMHRDGLTGVITPFTNFPRTPNPLPFGPPVIDPVPTRIIHRPEGGFYVSQLTGFPFIDGTSRIFEVDTNGSLSVLDSGLTMVTDLALSPDGDGLIALQFGYFRGDSLPPFVIGSGQIIKIGFDGSKDTIVSGFGPSPGLALGGDGDYYFTNLFFGTVSHFSPATTGVQQKNLDLFGSLSISPNPVRDHFNLQWTQPLAGEVELQIFSIEGKLIAQKKLGWFGQGPQDEVLDTTDLNLGKIPGQPMVAVIKTQDMYFVSRFILNQ